MPGLGIKVAAMDAWTAMSFLDKVKWFFLHKVFKSIGKAGADSKSLIFLSDPKSVLLVDATVPPANHDVMTDIILTTGDTEDAVVPPPSTPTT